MRTLFSVILLFTCFSSIAQDFLLDFYIEQDEGSGIVEDNQGNLVIVGTRFGPSKVHVIKVQTNGDTLWTTLIGDSIYNWQSAAYGDGGVVVLPDNRIAFVGTRYDNNGGNFTGYYCLLESNGILDTLVVFEDGDEYFFSSLILLSDGNLLISGTITPTSTPDNNDFFAKKIDPEGGVIWERSYPNTMRERAWSATETSDGNLLISGDYRYYWQYGNNYYKCQVVKVSGEGDLIWREIWHPVLRGGGLTGIIELASGEILVSGSCGSRVDERSAYIAKLDVNGELVWEKYWNENRDFAYFDGRPYVTEDGCIVNVGTIQYTWNPYNDQSGDATGLIFMLYPENDAYNIQFENYNSEFIEQFYSFAILEDKSVAVIGYARDSLGSRGTWLHLEDSSYCNLCHQLRTVSVDEVEGVDGAAYPNPTSDWVYVQLPEKNVKVESLVVYDISGNRVNTGIRQRGYEVGFDLTPLASGIYVYSIFLENKTMHGKVVKQ